MADRDLIPGGYPSPQAEVNTARDIAPAAAIKTAVEQHKAQDAPFIDGQFSEVKPAVLLGGPSMEVAPAKSRSMPLGKGVLWAAWRAGLKDLQNAVLNPFPQHVAQHEEPGSIANPTQLEVYKDKRELPDNATPNREASYTDMLDQTAALAPNTPRKEREGRSR